MTLAYVKTIPNAQFSMKRLTNTAVNEAKQLTFPGEFSTNRFAVDEARIKVFERVHKLYGGSISKFFNALDKRSSKEEKISARKSINK